MRRFAPLLVLPLAVPLALAACTPAQSPPPARPAATTAPPAKPNVPAPAPAPVPASAPLPPAEAEAAALARELEIERMYRSALPFRRGGAFGLVAVDAGAAAIAPTPEATAAWDKAAERLRGRFGALRPVTPLAADLAQGAEAARETPTLRLRRAGAAQGLEYLIVYRLDVAPSQGQGPFGGGLFGGGARFAGHAEAAILDVRTGAVLGAVTTEPSAPAPTEAAARAAAMTALADALDGLGRRLDADAMRAAAPPM